MQHNCSPVPKNLHMQPLDSDTLDCECILEGCLAKRVRIPQIFKMYHIIVCSHARQYTVTAIYLIKPTKLHVAAEQSFISAPVLLWVFLMNV